MWIWLDKTGKVYQSLVHGNAPVVGETDFKIFAYFDGLDPETINAATIKFRRPDMQGSTYPVLFMRQKDLNYVPMASDGNNCLFKVSNNPYRGFIFDFADFLNGEEIVKILDTPGTWEVTITLLRFPNKTDATGLIKFYVAPSTSEVASDDMTEIDKDQVIENLVLSLNALNQKNTTYVKVSSDFIADATNGDLDANIFTVGSVVFDKKTKDFYRILTITENSQDETAAFATYEKELDFNGKLNIFNGIYVTNSTNELETNLNKFEEGQIFYVKSTKLFYQKINDELVEYVIFDAGNTFLTVEQEPYVIPPEDR